MCTGLKMKTYDFLMAIFMIFAWQGRNLAVEVISAFS
jgi:hypothetical protein